MTRSSIAAVAAVLMAFPALVGAQRAPQTDTVRFVELEGGNPVGTMRVWRDPTGATHYASETHDRGRGPHAHVIVRLDSAGMPTEVRVAAGDTVPNPGNPRVTVLGDSVALATPQRVTGFRLGQATFAFGPIPTPEDLGLLVRVAVTRPESTLAIWVSGTVATRAHVRWLTSRRIGSGAMARIAQLFAVEIPSRSRLFVWLDDRADLLADQEASWIRAEYVADAGTLVRAMDSLMIPAMAAAAHAVGRRPDSGFAIVHATLIDVEAKAARPHTTVVVRGTLIESVGDDGSVALPPGIRVIDATNQWLVPGLWDMHAHPSDGADGYGRGMLLRGVTTMRSLLAVTNDPWQILQRQRRVDAGTELGPRLVNAGGFIDGVGDFVGPTRASVATLADATRWVNAYADSGFEQIKIYNSMTPALVAPIAALAHARGLRVSGHVPSSMTAEGAVRAGYDELNHINFIALNFLGGDTIDTRGAARFTVPAERAGRIDTTSRTVADFFTLLHDRNITVDPTLCVYVPPLMPVGAPPPKRTASDSVMMAMVGMMYRRGIRLVAGTDNSCTIPDELQLYVSVGIPPIEAIRIATLGAAEYTHRAATLGSIARGKLADMILVSGDPLANVAALRRVTQVVKDGVVYDMAALRTPLVFP